MTGARDAQYQNGLLKRYSGGRATCWAICSGGVEEVMLDGPNSRRMGREGSAWNGHIEARGGIGSQETGLVCCVLTWGRNGDAIMRDGDFEGGWRTARSRKYARCTDWPVHCVWSLEIMRLDFERGRTFAPSRRDGSGAQGAVNMSSSGPIEWPARVLRVIQCV